jgi:hypothetical protein
MSLPGVTVESGHYDPKKFDRWWQEFKNICWRSEAAYIADDQESFLEFFIEGYSPEEAFDEEMEHINL